MTTDEAVEREQLAKAQVIRDERAAEKRQSLREVREAMLAKLAGAEDIDDDADEPMDASNAVVDLVQGPDEGIQSARSRVSHLRNAPLRAAYGADQTGRHFTPHAKSG